MPNGRYRAVMDNGIVENEVGPVVRVLLDAVMAPRPDEVAETVRVAWPEVVARAVPPPLRPPWASIDVNL